MKSQFKWNFILCSYLNYSSVNVRELLLAYARDSYLYIELRLVYIYIYAHAMLPCPVKDHRRGIYRSIVGGLGRFHGRDIDELSAKCPLRGVTWPSHRRGMGVDAHCERLEWAGDSTAIHRRPPMIFNLKNRCTVLMTSHIT